MRPVTRILSGVVVGTLAATLVASPASAVRSTTIKPGKLARGADVAIPHLEGRTVVDGSVRFRVKAPTVRLLGTSGAAYIVGTANKGGSHGKFFRYLSDGTSTRLGRADLWTTELSGDGANLVTTHIARNRTTVITVRSATTGATVASRRFRGYVSALDAEADRVLVGSLRRTRLWTTGTDRLATVSRLGGYEGDLSADVVAGYTRDPYNGGCSVLMRITTGDRLWTSCKERVATFNADASRMATIDILSDGIGPSRVWVRTTSGSKLGRYDISKGWFGTLEFETGTALLLEAHGARQTATVRCTGSTCERASDLSDTEPLRQR
jgi:hypothetical protein